MGVLALGEDSRSLAQSPDFRRDFMLDLELTVFFPGKVGDQRYSAGGVLGGSVERPAVTVERRQVMLKIPVEGIEKSVAAAIRRVTWSLWRRSCLRLLDLSFVVLVHGELRQGTSQWNSQVGALVAVEVALLNEDIRPLTNRFPCFSDGEETATGDVSLYQTQFTNLRWQRNERTRRETTKTRKKRKTHTERLPYRNRNSCRRAVAADSVSLNANLSCSLGLGLGLPKPTMGGGRRCCGGGGGGGGGPLLEPGPCTVNNVEV